MVAKPWTTCMISIRLSCGEWHHFSKLTDLSCGGWQDYQLQTGISCLWTLTEVQLADWVSPVVADRTKKKNWSNSLWKLTGLQLEIGLRVHYADKSLVILSFLENSACISWSIIIALSILSRFIVLFRMTKKDDDDCLLANDSQSRSIFAGIYIYSIASWTLTHICVSVCECVRNSAFVSLCIGSTLFSQFCMTIPVQL